MTIRIIVITIAIRIITTIIAIIVITTIIIIIRIIIVRFGNHCKITSLAVVWQRSG